MESIDLDGWVRDRFGTRARPITVGDHLYDWRVDVDGRVEPDIEMEAAVQHQYGPAWRAVAVGAHKYDWRAMLWQGAPRRVLPVVMVASDRFDNISGVRAAVERLHDAVLGVRWWYGGTVGRTFRVEHPVIVPSHRSSNQWDQLSEITDSGGTAHRHDLYNALRAEFEETLGQAPAELRVVMCPYSGDSKDVWKGALGDVNGPYVAIPQRATSVGVKADTLLDWRGEDVVYAIGHELGHAFGLAHSCPEGAPPSDVCHRSIMGIERGWDAILLPGEKAKLLASPFFTEAA